jgi:class 3 adenylate cyclase
MTRTLLGRALLEVGEETAARMELRAARSAFSELGAVIHERQVAKLLGEEDSRSEHRVRLTFMFTDIVRSTDMAAALGDEAWTQLLQWHDRNLREAFVQHHGQEVKHTGDGFFVAFENAADAIACAVAIQRLLDRQRRDHGFAPRVRIGLHTAEATYADGDYSGHGVHVAARIGAIAEGDEILVSSVTREAAGEASLPTGEPREVTLKGVQDPVEVSAIEWR